MICLNLTAKDREELFRRGLFDNKLLEAYLSSARLSFPDTTTLEALRLAFAKDAARGER